MRNLLVRNDLRQKWYGWNSRPRSGRVALVLCAGQVFLAFVSENHYMQLFFAFIAGSNLEMAFQATKEDSPR